MTEPAAAAPKVVSLAEQIVEVEKTIRDRGRNYPDLVARGRLLPETADHKLAALRAVQSTLTWLEKNEDWIKPEAARRSAARKAAAEADTEAQRTQLEQHPAVKAVREHFPDADVHLPGEGTDLFSRDVDPPADGRAATA